MSRTRFACGAVSAALASNERTRLKQLDLQDNHMAKWLAPEDLEALHAAAATRGIELKS